MSPINRTQVLPRSASNRHGRGQQVSGGRPCLRQGMGLRPEVVAQESNMDVR